MIQRRVIRIIGLIGLLLVMSTWLRGEDTPDAGDESTAASPPTTVVEARARATLLHETIHGALQVMHRDFFNEEDAGSIPSASLEDVFRELERSHDVKVRWLIVETDIVNVDHQAENEIEKQAIKALKAGKPRFDAVQAERYHFVGAIRLASQCLKCHVRQRTSTEERTAGLSISMPLSPK